MKIIYFGSPGCSDNDFPLIKALQEKGVDVFAFFYTNKVTANSSLFNINLFQKDAIIPMSKYKGLEIYKSYFDMNNCYVINNYHYGRRYWQYWIMWIKVFFQIRKIDADLIHMTWPFERLQKVLYWLNVPKILTVHDPIPHSSQRNERNEKNRLLAFKKAQGFVLLSTALINDFCKFYHIEEEKICINKMGWFNHLSLLTAKSNWLDINKPFILYFGQIQSHKGVDILMKAVVEVHKTNPNVELIVAGKGNYYFDLSPYNRLNYIKIINRYITTDEMATLFSNCQFAILPYLDATQSGVVQTAFSLNAPLIVTRVGDLPNSVKDDMFGKVIPPNDVNSLVDSIRYLLDNPKVLSQYKKNISCIWTKNQDWGPIADVYIDYYNRILSEQQKSNM